MSYFVIDAILNTITVLHCKRNNAKSYQKAFFLRPKKKIMSVSSDMSKNIRVGRSEIFFKFFYFSKEVMTKLFSPTKFGSFTSK